MSSSTYTVTLVKHSGANVQLRIRAGTAISPNDYAKTPMFALMILAEARTKAAELSKKKGTAHALEKAAKAWPDSFRDDYDFWTKDLPTYIAGTKAKQVNKFKINQWTAKHYAQIEKIEKAAKSTREAEDALCKEFPYTILDVTLADAKWADGLSTEWIWETTGYDPETPKPLPKIAPNADLSNQQLEWGWSKWIQNLSGVNFTGSKLRAPGQTYIVLKDCVFDRATFIPSFEWDHCTFTNVSFKKAKIVPVRFTSCTFENCDFSGSDLTNSTFDNCTMKGNKFTGVKIAGVSFRGMRKPAGLPKK